MAWFFSIFLLTGLGFSLFFVLPVVKVVRAVAPAANVNLASQPVVRKRNRRPNPTIYMKKSQKKT